VLGAGCAKRRGRRKGKGGEGRWTGRSVSKEWLVGFKLMTTLCLVTFSPFSCNVLCASNGSCAACRSTWTEALAQELKIGAEAGVERCATTMSRKTRVLTGTMVLESLQGRRRRQLMLVGQREVEGTHCYSEDIEKRTFRRRRTTHIDNFTDAQQRQALERSFVAICHPSGMLGRRKADVARESERKRREEGLRSSRSDQRRLSGRRVSLIVRGRPS
jgi:hypothetical protein